MKDSTVATSSRLSLFQTIYMSYTWLDVVQSHLQKECQKKLQELAKIAILADLTLMLAWRQVNSVLCNPFS